MTKQPLQAQTHVRVVVVGVVVVVVVLFWVLDDDVLHTVRRCLELVCAVQG
jgi:hypothetical protein